MPLHTAQHRASQPLRRLVVVVTATALMLTGLTAAPALQTPAHAASVCTSMTPGDPGVPYNGIIRISSNGLIAWSMVAGQGCAVSFPPGGSLYVRVLKLQNASGGGCNSTVIKSYGWVHYVDHQTQLLASIGGGQCFRVQYKAGNWNSANTTHYGRLGY